MLFVTLYDVKYDVKCDLWSVGIILYKMVYKNHPYGNPINILDLIDRLKKRVIEFSDSNISEDCVNLMIALLKTDPKERIEWNGFFNHKWFDDSDTSFNNNKDNDYLKRKDNAMSAKD